MAARTLLFAGGGSGGHISPGLAIAERLVEIDPTVRCVFACSERAIDAAMLSEAGVAYERMPASVFSARPLPLLRFLGNNRRTKPSAGELIQTWVLATGAKMKIGRLAGMIAPYPTLGEVSKRAAGSYYTEALFGERTRRIVRLLGRLG